MKEASGELKELEEQVIQGLREAYRKMAEFKKRNNSPMIVSENGKVIAIPPEEIPPTVESTKPN